MITPLELRKLVNKSAIERLAADRYDGSLEKLLNDLSASLNQLLQSDLKKAKSFLQGIQKVFTKLPRQYSPRLLAMEGRLLHWSGESKIAARKYEVAVKRFMAQGEKALLAQTRQGLMDVYMYLGKHDQALQLGKQALTYFHRQGLETNAARVLTNIGNVYHRLDQNIQALKYYDRAREIFAKKGGIPLAIVDFNRANIYVNLNELDTAEDLYHRVRQVCQEQGAAIFEAKVDYSLAYLYFLRDEYTKSLTAFERALAKFEKLGDAKAGAVTRLDLAEINIYLNQFGSASMLGTEVFGECKKLGLRYEQGKAAYFAAEATRQLGDFQEATNFLHQAESLFRRENNRLWSGLVMLSRSQLLLAQGRQAKSDGMAREASRQFAQSADVRRQIDAETVLAETELKGEKVQEALVSCRDLLSRRPLGYQQYRLHRLAGLCHLTRSEPKRAYNEFRKAVNISESAMLSLQQDESRYFFSLGRYETYLYAVQCLLQLGQVERSFAQHLRALAFLNHRPERYRQATSEVPAQYLERRSELRAALKRLTDTSEAGGVRTASAEVLRQLDTRFLENERKIRSCLYPDLAGASLQTVTPEFASTNLRENEIVVNYVKIDSDVGAFVASRDGVRFVGSLVEYETLESQLRELHFLMESAVLCSRSSTSSPGAIDHYLEELYRILIEPLQIVGEERLIFLLEGIFAQVPFSILPGINGERLIDTCDIRVIVNPADLSKSTLEPFVLNGTQSAVFSVPSEDLPLVSIEGRKVSEMLSGSRLYSDEEATSVNLKHSLTESRGIIHIAAHASRSSENPLFSRLLMSDGPFFPFDLFNLDCQVQLVTLSGCQTAAPGIYYGNSFSLAKAFHQAGARFVLATLWPVSDKISLMFVTEFYKALKETADPPVAYKVAMIKVKAINSNPAYWGPFVLLGI